MSTFLQFHRLIHEEVWSEHHAIADDIDLVALEDA